MMPQNYRLVPITPPSSFRRPIFEVVVRPAGVFEAQNGSTTARPVSTIPFSTSDAVSAERMIVKSTIYYRPKQANELQVEYMQIFGN